MQIREFRGYRPGQHPYNQQVNYATQAGNIQSRSGEFYPLRAHAYLDTQPLLAGVKSIHVVRRNDGTYNVIQIGDYTLAESINDKDERENIYFYDGINDFTKVTSLRGSYTDQVTYGGWNLAEAQPFIRFRPTVEGTQVLSQAGTKTADTTLVATYITVFGDETAPSIATPVFAYDYTDTAHVTVDLPASITIIKTLRIYMAINGELRLIHEQDIVLDNPVNGGNISGTRILPDGTLINIIRSSDFTLDPTVPELVSQTSEAAAPPREPIKNIVNLAGGRLAGASKNYRSVYVSDPGDPLSWPHEIDIDRRIVRIMRYGDDLLVLTDGRPSVILNTDIPQEQELPFVEPCIAVESAVDMGFGVFYVSYSGICMIQGYSGQVLTMDNRLDGRSEIINVEDWQTLPLKTIKAAEYRGQYVFYYFDGAKWVGRMYSPSYEELINLPDINATNFYFVKNPDASIGKESLEIYMEANGQLKRYRFNDGDRELGFWEKTYQVPQSEQFVYARVQADDYQGASLSINGKAVSVTSDKIFTLPQSYRARTATVRFESRSITQTIELVHAREDFV